MPTVEPSFPTLFTPLTIRDTVVKNRIFSSGHDTVMAEDGRVTDQLVAYHEARARGGVGLIVMQVVGVHETARYTSHVLMANDDSYIEGYRKVAEAVHRHGTAVFAQLLHPGREIMESQDGTMPVALAPSAVPSERFHVVPRPMSTALISEIVEGYAKVAGRLQRAGLDGVEIVASHAYLPAQFMSPHVNRRADGYGGSLENRLRFVVEIAEAVRTEVTDEFVVGLRMSADEMVGDVGLGLDESVAVARRLDELQLLDYLSVTAGSSATLAGSDHIVPSMSEPAAYVAPLARPIKESVSVPVLVAGRINQPQEAEQVLASGDADACAMTRALICDPELPNKASAGGADTIRACIACNQACIGHFHAGYPISCIQRPETGREIQFGIHLPTRRARKVLVVGGGPAGLKAAAVAAERGHKVTLYDRGKRLGGQILLAELLPGRAEFGGAATNLISEAERAGARLVTRRAVDLELVRSEEPDTVIVATGAQPWRPPLELTDDMPVVDAWDVIQGATMPRGHLVVADWRSDWIGLGVAQMLAQAGHQVTLALAAYQPGEQLQQYVRDSMVAEAYRLGVAITPLVRPYGADDDTVYLQQVLTGGPVLIEGVAGLVLAQGHQSEVDLLHELDDYAGDVRAVGDCLAPRTVEEAVLEGMKVGHIVGDDPGGEL